MRQGNKARGVSPQKVREQSNKETHGLNKTDFVILLALFIYLCLQTYKDRKVLERRNNVYLNNTRKY